MPESKQNLLAGSEYIRITGARQHNLKNISVDLPPKDVADDVNGQLQRLLPRRFLLATDWVALQHLPRYLKAIVMRLDKHRRALRHELGQVARLR